MKKFVLISMVIATLISCSKDEDPNITLPPSEGSTMQLEGGEGGSQAVNSVYVDFSADKQTSVLRSSWDLGFYTGSEFNVIINNTTVAYATATSKTDLSAVGSADTVGVKLHFDQMQPSSDDFEKMDNLNGDISQTIISAAETDNKVYILNRGTGGGREQDDYIKLKVTRSGNGYALEYAALTAAEPRTIQVDKNGNGNFVYVNLENGATVNGFPEKEEWDIQWTLSAYRTMFGPNNMVMYPNSDLVAINHLNGVQAFEAVYGSDAAATDAYTKFNTDSVAQYTFSNDRWVIGNNWRDIGMSSSTVLKERFYVVKDPTGNVYKLKFISMGATDGGTRGRPEIQYLLIN